MPRKPTRRILRRVMHAARGHRTTQTQAEDVLWAAVRGQQIDGLQFRRQHPVGPFILDFYCPKRKLCIELDGAYHEAQKAKDAARTEALATLKIRVLRFRNAEVLNDLPAVLLRLRNELSITT